VWWPTSVIPAIQEAQIRRITIQGQYRQKVSETLSPSISLACWHAPVNPAPKEGTGRSWSQASPKKQFETLPRKRQKTKAKKGWEHA
jgi:hypothetical protein